MTGSADVWAEAMLAAALVAVDPGLGGAVVRAGPGAVRDAWVSGFRGLLSSDRPWRRLPSGIGDERLLGGLDLGAALGSGRRVLQRGLLAEANGGVVIAAMAERLGPGIAARLAGALEDGAVMVERDGITERLQAGFVLIALDEGVTAEEQIPLALADRLAFHIHLDGVGHREALPISATPADIAEARATLARVEAPGDPAIEAICAAAVALGIESMRAPRLALRVACALAALEGREGIDEDDLRTAARMVLGPRATRLPPAESEAAADGSDQTREENGDGGSGQEEAESGPDADGALNEVVLEAARAALPEGLDTLWLVGGVSPRGASVRSGGTGAKQASASRGRPIGARPGTPREASGLDLVETLKAAAPWQRVRGGGRGSGSLKIRRDDFRVRRFQQKAETTVIFIVDASGSAALQRLAETKGAVELLLAEAYVKRTQVALIAFRGSMPALLLPPTRSLTRARRSLAEMAGGGATPLAAALEAGAALATAERAKGRTPLLVIMTDGRGNIALDGAAFRTRAETDAMNAARRIRAAGFGAALIDISQRPRGDGSRLADAMGARFAALPYVEAGRVRDVVRSLDVAGTA